ncbi:MAG: NADPH-dependent FMN reductase [Coriobacteriales bacterium]|nr:NADPH-dependent FMN reductase [Coriobacteriales bacterium]
MKKVLLIVGSLRKQSFNRQLAGVVRELIADQAQVEELVWTDVPLLNQDIENPVPPAVARIREEVSQADAIWICTPEYNSNIPGGEKNLLDWLSRPADPADITSPSVIKGKVAAISGVGGRPATAGVRAKMEELLGFMGLAVVGGTGFGFSLDPASWMSNELTLTEEKRSELEGLVGEFIDRLNG